MSSVGMRRLERPTPPAFRPLPSPRRGSGATRTLSHLTCPSFAAHGALAPWSLYKKQGHHLSFDFWCPLSGWGDSNARPLRPERSALPTALHPEIFYLLSVCFVRLRIVGLSLPQGNSLPPHSSSLHPSQNLKKFSKKNGSALRGFRESIAWNLLLKERIMRVCWCKLEFRS